MLASLLLTLSGEQGADKWALGGLAQQLLWAGQPQSVPVELVK